jgi:hypothetical protein
MMRSASRARTEAIANEARFDGIYILRTSLSAGQANAAATVRTCKSPAQVERAFRCLKAADLEPRPVMPVGHKAVSHDRLS